MRILVLVASVIPGLFLPPAIREFRKRFPVVDLTILDLVPQEQMTALMDRRIDLGFVPLPVVNLVPDIEFETVREVDLVAALPPEHRLAKQRRLTLRSLVHEPFVLLSDTQRHSAARPGRSGETTQIYEGTNQIQRVVIAKRLLS
jgi:DNA-binding transcriptional LysR family regulator